MSIIIRIGRHGGRMFCLYSKGCEYAIRAAAEMAAGTPGKKYKAVDICRRTGLSEAYARKSFQALVRAGFLTAVPGPGGGYTLAKDPARTTVMDLVEAIDGSDSYSGCVMGLPSCNDRHPCQLHPLWLKMRSDLLRSLRSVTLKDMVGTAKGRRPA